MDPNRISEEDAHCLRAFLRLHGNIDLQDAALASQEARLLSESCRKLKQAFLGVMQKVSTAQAETTDFFYKSAQIMKHVD